MAEKKRPPGENHIKLYFKERHESDKKLELLKKEQDQKKVEECTFSPTIIKTWSTKDVMTRYSLSNFTVGVESGKGGNQADQNFTASSGN